MSRRGCDALAPTVVVEADHSPPELKGDDDGYCEKDDP